MLVVWWRLSIPVKDILRHIMWCPACDMAGLGSWHLINNHISDCCSFSNACNKWQQHRVTLTFKLQWLYRQNRLHTQTDRQTNRQRDRETDLGVLVEESRVASPSKHLTHADIHADEYNLFICSLSTHLMYLTDKHDDHCFIVNDKGLKPLTCQNKNNSEIQSS